MHSCSPAHRPLHCDIGLRQQVSVLGAQLRAAVLRLLQLPLQHVDALVEGVALRCSTRLLVQGCLLVACRHG